jgi:hypothetical protein
MAIFNSCIFFQQCVSICPSLPQMAQFLSGFFSFDLVTYLDFGRAEVIVGELAVMDYLAPLN